MHCAHNYSAPSSTQHEWRITVWPNRFVRMINFSSHVHRPPSRFHLTVVHGCRGTTAR